MTEFTGRQKQIIDVSVKLIAEGGIQELTIKNISGQIGISEPAIYRHFKSKVDILLGILQFFEGFASVTLENVRKLETADISNVEDFMMSRFQRMVEKPVFASVVFSEEIFRNEIKLSDRVLNIMEIHREALTVLLRKAMDSGEVRDDVPVEKLCHILMGSLRLQIKMWFLSDFSFDLMKEGRELWETLKVLISSPSVK